MTLMDSSGNTLQQFQVPPLGMVLLDSINAGSYRIRDEFSGLTANLTVEASTKTVVISLMYFEEPDIPDPPDIPEIDIDDEPPPPPDIDAGAGDEEDWDFDFDGPVAEPGGDPFTVADDPEAIARVESVDSFEELPGVGIGSAGQSHSRAWFAYAGVLALMGIGGAAAGLRRRNQSNGHNRV
jgi:hypothetical protein